ncbi:MAG: PAS domain S-box protein [Verrucomicrobia bacterium]|nr:PAS domain S-box protein [Verrucomicrobiota bacterium]
MAKVLIVDDERSIRRSLCELLHDAGYQVAEAEDAEAALVHLRAAPFDVVISDIILPRVSGVELLRQLQATAPEVQVVMMTGEPTAETAASALRLGATDYLFKPITKAAILRATANAARIKFLEDARRRLEEENKAHRERLEQLVAERTSQLRVSEGRYRNLVETTFDWVWEVDADARYTYASPRVLDLLGYRPEEVIGRTPFDLMPEAEARRVRAIFEQIAARRDPFSGLENTNVHRNGQLVILESNGTPVFSPTGEFLGYHGMDRNVTARKQAEEQLRKLARAVDQSPVSIVITDREGKIEFVNPKFTEVSGYTAEEALGNTPRIQKSGETPLEEYRRLWGTILAGGEWRGEFHNKRKNGSLFWETVSISAMRDPAGAITHFVAVKEDVTEKKQLEARFLRAQRVESIGSLASGIAHDLNNMLTPILMGAALLRKATYGPRDQELVQVIDSSTRRAIDVVRQLLGFARGQESSAQPVQLRHLVREMIAIARETFPRNLQFQDRCAPDLWPVLANATQIHQVLVNLSVNARDAMPQGGTLTFRAANVTLDEHYVAMHPQATVGRFVRLEVQDTGVGIPEELRERVFESFFTTKGEGQGTGLGLTTVLGIVRDHKGFISFTSEVGRGTTFEIHLPAIPGAASGGDAVAASEAPRGQGELILVVDDELPVCAATCLTLEGHGYRTLRAHNGIDALAEFSRHLGQVHAVVTDFMMPLMDGVTLCRTLRKLSPGTPLIVSSGGLFGKGGARTMESYREIGVRHILHKPHNAEVLLQALAAELQVKAAVPPPPAPEEPKA